ncbi:hypothetical Protein YC6258_01887 [Gynuella sunshinyii YC6258]|uniref:Uncharacterized protein n=1 Tax=Gynuella sunshinyii YC6258 TaxID=1445510 RepID=A0A0C5VI28_9GAMM|nr:hypothetical Protein YC6258_01887 [Gynuella sunshinyii YC6258]
MVPVSTAGYFKSRWKILLLICWLIHHNLNLAMIGFLFNISGDALICMTTG